jgi:hypothetical protein
MAAHVAANGPRRKPYASFLAYSLLAMLGGLPAGCLLGGLLLSAWQLAAHADPRSAGQGLAIGLFAMPIGLLPAVVYGVPLYALLAWRGWARLPVVAVAGALSGLWVAPWSSELAWFVSGFGTAVAVCTHAVAARRMHRLGEDG